MIFEFEESAAQNARMKVVGVGETDQASLERGDGQARGKDQVLAAGLLLTFRGDVSFSPSRLAEIIKLIRTSSLWKTRRFFACILFVSRSSMGVERGLAGIA